MCVGDGLRDAQRQRAKQGPSPQRAARSGWRARRGTAVDTIACGHGTQGAVAAKWPERYNISNSAERNGPRVRAIPMIPVDATRQSPAARLDLYAVGLSTLCVLHCVALPVLVALLPVAAQAAESEFVHRVLVVAAVPVSLRVIWTTRPLDGNRMFIGGALAGLGLLLLAAFVETVSPYEQPITVVGGVLLASAHLWHWMTKCGTRGVRGVRVEPDEL